MRAVLHATKIWLLLALMSFVCVSFAGAHGYQNGYWLFAIGCWLVLDFFCELRDCCPGYGSFFGHFSKPQ